MTTFKTVAVRIPIEAHERIEKLIPSMKWHKHLVPGFRGQILLYGLEHPNVLKMEYERQIEALKRENASLKRQVAIANSRRTVSASAGVEDVLKLFGQTGPVNGGGVSPAQGDPRG